MLPFVNRSRDEEDEYFSDGLADELLNVLVKIRGLRVAARTSPFQFKGRNEDIAVIGSKAQREGVVRRQDAQGLTEMKCDPALRGPPTDPRWEVLLRKMGLAQ